MVSLSLLPAKRGEALGFSSPWSGKERPRLRSLSKTSIGMGLAVASLAETMREVDAVGTAQLMLVQPLELLQFTGERLVTL